MAEMRSFDRAAQDLGNIVELEHVNLAIPDQRLATLFYVVGLGFTRDPYLMVGDDNMWINVGRQQFHLPTRGTHLLRGHTGIVVPDLGELAKRLESVRERLAGTRFSMAAEPGRFAVTCPWGNRFRCHQPGPCFGDMTLGIPYVEFAVRTGAASGIARFYEQAFGARCILSPDGKAVTVPSGRNQSLVYRESAEAGAAYDGHHVAIYVSDFSGPHGFLLRNGLITEESDDHQYRFKDLIDPASGAKLFEIEHEVRSLRHPLYGRVFVNRNPAQSQRGYRRGRDAYYG